MSGPYYDHGNTLTVQVTELLNKTLTFIGKYSTLGSRKTCKTLLLSGAFCGTWKEKVSIYPTSLFGKTLHAVVDRVTGSGTSLFANH
jgi:hypothetical protein